MSEQLPDWIAVPAIIIVSVWALYACYIEPNTRKKG